MIVEWLPAAIADFRSAMSYLEDRNAAVAAKLAAKVLYEADRLQEFPRRGRPGKAPDTRELVTVHPYVLVYRVVADRNTVTILRLWHSAQNR